MKKMFLSALLSVGVMTSALAESVTPILVDKATVTKALLNMPYDFITSNGEYLLFYVNEVGSDKAFNEVSYNGEDRFNACMKQHKSMSSALSDRYQMWMKDNQGVSFWIQYNSDSLAVIAPFVFKDSSMRTGYLKYCRGDANEASYGSIKIDSFDKVKDCINTKTY